MYSQRLSALVLASSLARFSQGQAVWTENQVNTTICEWSQLRAAVVRDTIYLDGGNTLWLPGLADGSYGAPHADGNPRGIVFTLNFSTPFNTRDNITAIFGTISRAPEGSAANNIAPNYFDGAMLANDHQWMLYGGMPKDTSEFELPEKDETWKYEKYQYGVEKEAFSPGFVRETLPESVSNYIAYGGAASAPSENKAWYFSGLVSPSGGEIFEPSVDDPDRTAVNVSRTLITLDMKTQQEETWTNTTLGRDIPGRANPELVWVPVGEQGILVALGGVVEPDFVDILGEFVDLEKNEEESPEFMSTIDIYDVASGDWYRQPTKDGPGQLTRGCAVVASAQDRSSFNIYYYGGYDGLNQLRSFNDDVWVLSLPSFTWTKVASGSGSGRAGHKCFTPYPDQMLVIGGYTTRPKTVYPTCLQETIRVFNLTTGTWVNEYDPAKWTNYSVPATVHQKIGGSGTGGATATEPSEGWAATGLANVFDTPYDTSKITTYYPYPSLGAGDPTNPNTPPPSDDESGGGGGVPSFLPPVLGVVLGLMFITMIVVLVLLWRRRRLFKSGMSEAGTEDTNGHRIMSWMRGQTSETKAPTVTTMEEVLYSPHHDRDLESSVAVTVSPPPPSSMTQTTAAEMANTEIIPPAELMDTSPPAELHDTGLSHIDVMTRYSHFGESPSSGATGSLNNSSFFSNGTHQVDHASTVSRSSAGILGNASPIGHQHHQSPLSADFRPDSDLLGLNSPGESTAATSPNDAATTGNRQEVMRSPSPAPTNDTRGGSAYVLSGVSNLSERDRAHLRQISDATVSSVTSGPADRGASPIPGDIYSPTSVMVGTPQPVSPPTAGVAEGNDYISARVQPPPPPPPQQAPTSHPTQGLSRRSIFHESREDMNDDKGRS